MKRKKAQDKTRGERAEAGCEVDEDRALDFYRSMARVRKFEEAAAQYVREGSIPGFIHAYIGEEAVAVGVCGALEPGDYVTSTHRGHGHALSRGLSMKSVMAELWGKRDGTNLGRGGSMHIFDASRHFLGTNGIVAGGVPLAAGAAFAIRYKKTGQIAVSFVGDGGTNHGAFLETLNIAAAFDLPLVIVVENNLYATSTPYACVTKTQDIALRGTAVGMAAETVDGNDVEEVHATARKAVARARGGSRPSLLVCQTYRTVGHYEGEPVAGTYRTWEEVEAWKQKDPIINYKKRLIERYGATIAEQLDRIDEEAGQEVASAVEFSRNAPFCAPVEATEHVYG